MKLSSTATFRGVVSLCTCVLIANATASATEDDSNSLQEVVVTAQKRTESANDVPQSLTVIAGDILERTGASSLQDLAQYAPGLIYSPQAGVGGGQLIMRGITSGNDQSATIAMYVDDVPYGSGTSYSASALYALELPAFDLQRVEVLRGPQGTLYGASAFGGVVKYVLTPPSTTEFGGEVQVEGSHTNGGNGNYAYRAAVNLPLNESWAVRLSGGRTHDGGYTDNVEPDGHIEDDANKSDQTVGRLSVLGKPTEELTVRAMLLTQDIDQYGSSLVDLDPTTFQPTSGRYDAARELKEAYSQNFRLYSIGADYNLSFATLTGTLGYQTINSYTFQDVALFTDLLNPISAPAGDPIDRTAIPQDVTIKKTTAELRLASPSNDSFEWLTGFYFTNEHNDNISSIDGYLNGSPVNYDFYYIDQPTTYREYTGYADGTYYVSPKFDVQLGARFTHDQQDVSQVSSGVLGGPSVVAPQVDDNVGTYLATARFHLDEHDLLYARVASGFRPGGPNLLVPDIASGALVGPTSFKSDKLWNYEIGEKLQPNRWMEWDVSAFYIDWTDIQLQGVFNGLGVFVNGGRADSKGIETSIIVQPMKGWTITESAAYTVAKLDDPVPGLDALSGQQLPNVPRLASSLATEYSFPLAAERGRVGAVWSFVGTRNAGYAGSSALPYVPEPSYSTVDLHADVDIGKFDINVYARNIFDRWGILSVDTSDTLYRASVLRPRTIGVMLTMSF